MISAIRPNTNKRLLGFFLCWLGVLTFFLPNTTADALAADIFDLGDLYFETVGDNETIPQGIVTTIAEDGHGLLWIGTQNGLVRYDGYRFRLFSHDPDDPESLSGNYIRTLWLASDGRLWIGTQTDGISVYDHRTDRFTRYRHQADNPNSLSHNRIDAIRSDAQGNLWIGTDGGLDYLNSKTGLFTHYRHVPDDPHSINSDRIRSLVIDRQGSLWVGSYDGLNRLRVGSSQFERMYSDPQVPGSLAGQTIIRLMLSGDGQVWLGTRQQGVAKINPDGGIDYIDVAFKQGDKLSQYFIVSLIQPNDDEIWLATYGGGIVVLDAQSGALIRRIRHDPAAQGSISLDHVGALWLDASGLIWVGTWGGGLNRFNPYNVAFRSLHYSQIQTGRLSHTDVLSIVELDDGMIWLGTAGNGIDIIDPQRGVIDGFRADADDPTALGDSAILALAQADDGTIWVGTRQAGLHRYLPQSRSFRRYTKADGLSDNSVQYILPDRSGVLWLATSTGVNRFDPNTAAVKPLASRTDPDKPLNQAFNIMVQQADGTLWAGSNDGLYLLPPSQQLLIPAGYQTGQAGALPHNHIQGLLVDTQDRLWVTTKLGVDRLLTGSDKQQPKFESINQLIRLFGTDLGGNYLQDEKGRIWSNKEMIDPKTWEVHQFSRANGINVGVVWVGSYSKTRSGTLLYGGAKGLLMVKPERFRPWTYQPKLAISDLIVDGKQQPTPVHQRLVLGPEVKSFTVEFTALDYSAPEQNRYAYRLDGYDPDWIETDAVHRTVSYTNLDPGNYNLLIRGSNRLGQWSPGELNLPVQQLATWYQSWWFTLLLLSLVWRWYLLWL